MKEADFNSCQQRQKFVNFKADGSQEFAFRCSEATAPHAYQDVKPADCVGCPVRRALLANPVPKRDQFADMSNLVRSPEGDGFLPCSHRLVQITHGCCNDGPSRERWVCGTDESVNYRFEVTPVICEQCPVRCYGKTEKGQEGRD